MLPRLNADAFAKVEVQETEFSHDLFGRYVCSTWEEVANNGGAPFDAVVIGAGMFGGACAEKLYRFGEPTTLRILVLDAGAFLASTHIQNLPHIGLGTPGDVAVPSNGQDPGSRNIVWGSPWHSNQSFPGLAYCPGGRSLFWGGWSPRLTEADLANWPPAVAQYLRSTYDVVENEIGVNPTTDYISGKLFTELLAAFGAALPQYEVKEAPLAVQGQGPESGLFSFDKYSSATLLIDAIREDVARRWTLNDDSRRRLMLLPRAHVTRLQTSGGKVTGIDLSVNGTPRSLGAPIIATNAMYVLGASTIESTRLALESFPTPKMGANLMAHLRTNTTVRVKRTVFAGLPKKFTDLETAALIVRGEQNGRRFHFQVTAAAVEGNNSEANLFTAIPDIDLLGNIKANQDQNWIVITLRGIGEMQGHKDAVAGDPSKSWINLAWDVPDQRDRFGKRPAWVNLMPTPADDAFWTAMEQRALDIAAAIAKAPGNIQYWYGGKWNANPPALGSARDKIGTTHHESGTLWMGADAAAITDMDGCFRHVDNAYVAGPALFPTCGSANPSLTGLVLARKTAQAIVQRLQPAPSKQFKALFTGDLAAWQMAGNGGFVVNNDVLESQGGIGLLWYTREQFKDFLLKVDWRATHPDDNSGVFLGFPALNSSNPQADWQLAVNHGYEVQIDDTGFNPDTGQFHDPAHQTGAIYALSPASKLASRPLGQWNTFEIEAKGDTITVSLNGDRVTRYKVDPLRPPAGHIGLQSHHPGSQVQFRNILIKSL
jgi:choline dehydrogenase-like flavoprotein